MPDQRAGVFGHFQTRRTLGQHSQLLHASISDPMVEFSKDCVCVENVYAKQIIATIHSQVSSIIHKPVEPQHLVSTNGFSSQNVISSFQLERKKKETKLQTK